MSFCVLLIGGCLTSAIRVSHRRLDAVGNLIDSIVAVPEAAATEVQAHVYDSSVAVVRVACADIRKKPGSQSERVTQALFMDRLRLVGKKGRWCKVEVVSQHGYPGWVERSLIESPVLDLVGSGTRAETLVVASRRARVFSTDMTAGDSGMSVPLGTYLEAVLQDSSRARVVLPSGEGWVDAGGCLRLNTLRQLDDSAVRNSVVLWAKSFVGVPYKWGGITQYGLDCSGLVYLCYRLNGILLERDGIPQFNAGAKVKREKLRPGDMVYFTTYKPGASHTGIYTGHGRFIQAGSSGGVVEAKLSDDYWRTRYFDAVSYLPFRVGSPLSDSGGVKGSPDSMEAGDGKTKSQ